MNMFSNQAVRVIQRFGGVEKLRLAMIATTGGRIRLSKVTIYKWTWPRDHVRRGAGGLIPAKYWQTIITSAVTCGIPEAEIRSLLGDRVVDISTYQTGLEQEVLS